MFSKLKSFFVGKPLDNESIGEQKLSVLWGFPILASDAVSSVAYAGQEMLIVLVPAISFLAFGQLTLISGAIICLLLLLVFSYRQTIDNYPNGGGAYIVAKENLGIKAGVTAAAALSIDYVMTVAVSVSSGVEQIATALTFLKPYSVIICVVLVILLMIGNLRGIKESSRIFGIPTYLFIFAMLSLIFAGAYKMIMNDPSIPVIPQNFAQAEPLTLFLLLKAFSSGCTALTGVEAVSNSVPNFREPTSKHAKKVLYILGGVILVLFGGVSIISSRFIPLDIVGGIAKLPEGAILVNMASALFGSGSFGYFFVAVTTFLILILAANTSYSGFPILLSVVAKEGYAPRQLSYRGDRLSFDNGIMLLSAMAIVLIIAFNAKVSSLIGLYAIGVFISFTLSQAGMFMKWYRQKGKHWIPKASINGLGAFITFFAVIIIAIAKFNEGAWIVVVAAPILIFVMLKVKRHYVAVQAQLKLRQDEYDGYITAKTYNNRVIVPISGVNRISMRAIRYAKTISDNVTAFAVVISPEEEADIIKNYKRLNTTIPLKVMYSKYRKVLEPLMEYIESEEFGREPGDMITVMLAQFSVSKGWQKILHNNTRYFLEKQLLKHRHIVVSVMPLQLKDDDFVYKNPDYKY